MGIGLREDTSTEREAAIKWSKSMLVGDMYQVLMMSKTDEKYVMYIA
jgi:hypothetical protein